MNYLSFFGEFVSFHCHVLPVSPSPIWKWWWLCVYSMRVNPGNAHYSINQRHRELLTGALFFGQSLQKKKEVLFGWNSCSSLKKKNNYKKSHTCFGYFLEEYDFGYVAVWTELHFLREFTEDVNNSVTIVLILLFLYDGLKDRNWIRWSWIRCEFHYGFIIDTKLVTSMYSLWYVVILLMTEVLINALILSSLCLGLLLSQYTVNYRMYLPFLYILT